MSNVQAAFFALTLAAALALVVNCDDSKPNRMCGKKLLRHAAVICNSVECDKDELNAPPQSAEGALRSKQSMLPTVKKNGPGARNKKTFR